MSESFSEICDDNLLGQGDVQLICEEEIWTLEVLPEEIIRHICSFLEANFIIHTLSKVCKTLQEILTSDSYWRTRIAKRWPNRYPPVSPWPDFRWDDACIAREEQYHLWVHPSETMDHFVLNQDSVAPVDAVHFMKNGTGNLLAAGSRDRYLKIINVDKLDADNPQSVIEATVYCESKTHKGWIWCLASLDNTLCTGSWDTKIRLFDLAEGCVLNREFKCKSAILDIHMENNEIIAVGFDKRLYMIDTRTNTIRKKSFHTKPILCLAVDDNYIISGSEDKTIVVCDRRTETIYKTLMLDRFPMSMSYGNNQLWVGGKGGQLHLYETTAGQFDIVETYDVGHTGKLTGVKHTPGAVFTCSSDHSIRVLEPNHNPRVISVINEHDADISGIDVHNNMLASAGCDMMVGIWKPKAQSPKGDSECQVLS